MRMQRTARSGFPGTGSLGMGGRGVKRHRQVMVTPQGHRARLEPSAVLRGRSGMDSSGSAHSCDSMVWKCMARGSLS